MNPHDRIIGLLNKIENLIGSKFITTTSVVLDLANTGAPVASAIERDLQAMSWYGSNAQPGTLQHVIEQDIYRSVKISVHADLEKLISVHFVQMEAGVEIEHLYGDYALDEETLLCLNALEYLDKGSVTNAPRAGTIKTTRGAVHDLLTRCRSSK